jgi:hypothetical protein
MGYLREKQFKKYFIYLYVPLMLIFMIYILFSKIVF